MATVAEQGDEVEFRIRQGEDYSAYVEWVDINGKPVADGDGSQAWMQVRAYPGAPTILDFTPDANITTEACATVLGSNGIIRLTVPRAVTATLPTGSFKCDLFVSRTDDEDVVFPLGQRNVPLSGTVRIIEPTTVVA